MNRIGELATRPAAARGPRYWKRRYGAVRFRAGRSTRALYLVPLSDIGPDRRLWPKGEKKRPTSMKWALRGARELVPLLRRRQKGTWSTDVLHAPEFRRALETYLDPPDPGVVLLGFSPPWRVNNGRHRISAARRVGALVVPATLEPEPKGSRPRSGRATYVDVVTVSNRVPASGDCN
jgi:hypothetical protein